jgi:SAM-dependent methyltransferase
MDERDPWLSKWLPIIAERASPDSVLEIGCGIGDGTETLVSAGLSVIALDLSEQAVAEARVRVPGAAISCQSVLHPFPLNGRIGAIVASLSLHDFPWAQTKALVARMRAILRPKGVLVSRLNSTQDHHYGASGHPEIEKHYYLVDGKPKRFFDRAAIDALFGSGWTRLSVEHAYTTKYKEPKALWELVVERHA